MASPQISLPAEMSSGIDYSLPPDAKSFTVKVQPSNVSSVTANYTCPTAANSVVADTPFISSQIIFDLPAGANPSQFLDTRMTTLNFDALFETTTAGVAGTMVGTFLRGGGFSWIDSIRVVAQNGNIIEQIDEFGLVNNMLCGLQMNNSVRDSLAVQYGFNSSTGISNQGHEIMCLSQTYPTAAVTTKERHSYSFPLASGVLGVLADKFLSIGRTSRIQLIIQTAQIFPISCTVGATAYTTAPVVKVTLGNFSLNCEYIDIGLSALKMLDAASPDGILYNHGTTYRTTSSTLPAVAGSVSILAGLRASSIKSLFCIFNDLGAISTANSSNGKYDSKNPNLTSININLGGLKYPQYPVTPLLSPAITMSELQKAIGSFNNAAYQSSIPTANYCKLSAGGTGQALNNGQTQVWEWNTGTSNDQLAQFYFGVNLEVVSKKNILSGLNATSSPIFIEMNTAAAPTNSHTVYTIAMIDHILVHDTKTGDISVRI